ncbi:MAG TPA: HAMP domain-containing sensor histidine kinase [Thermoanaerobaculia bacterium]
MRSRSLHARLVWGAVIWSAGILVAAFAVGLTAMFLHPRWALLIHNSFLIVVGVVLVTAGVSVIRRSLSPLRLLRERLAAVRDGRTARLEGDYPSEVEPLVDDLNLLLAEREASVARAVAKAGDLAHGLKTPLAVLAQEIERAEVAGQPDLAVSIRRQVERMRRQIDSHLAQARVAASGQAPRARANVATSARALVRTMQRLYADRALAFEIDVADEVAVRVPAEDLEEMLGNLLDNACKWARSTVTVGARQEGGSVVVDVDDDGAGLAPELWEKVLQRGVRADEAAPGSGLGLAIVRELAEAYGGGIALEKAPAGGVRARLTLPAG